MLKDGERLEPLGGGVRVIVSNEHRFTTDTVLLAHFSALKKNETAVELGSGCGAIPLLWNKTGAPKHIDAVELQSDAADMLTRSVALNGFEETISVFQKDLRCLKGTLPFGVYDLAACNPPYKMLGSGLQNPREAHRLARHECACTLEDTALAAAQAAALRRTVLYVPAPGAPLRYYEYASESKFGAETPAHGAAARGEGAEARAHRGKARRAPRRAGG